ncbi:MAG: hypothetical protein HY428_02670 [Candidatus Levybacteria bacterium]|nr:hypothetical protein [Candidatus Levybacteria bacterium]
MIARGKEGLLRIANRFGLGREIPLRGQDIFVSPVEHAQRTLSTAVMFDFATMDNEPFLRQQLGRDYIPTVRYLIAGAVALATNSDKALELFFNLKPRTTLVWAATDRFDKHGEGVIATMRRLRRRLRHYEDDSVPEIIPLQDVLDLEFKRDQLGNHGLAAHFGIDKMTAKLNNRQERFVNISFQDGGEVYAERYELDPRSKQIIENKPPKVKIRGAFDLENAERNLRHVSLLLNAHRDRVFSLSGGNNKSENMRYVLEEYPDIVPDNAFFVGEWVEDEEEAGPAGARGLPLYVPNGIIPSPGGSSQSAGILTELCYLYAKINNLSDDPKSAAYGVISKCTEERTYRAPRIDRETNLPIPSEFEVFTTRVFVPSLVERELMAA